MTYGRPTRRRLKSICIGGGCTGLIQPIRRHLFCRDDLDNSLTTVIACMEPCSGGRWTDRMAGPMCEHRYFCPCCCNVPHGRPPLRPPAMIAAHPSQPSLSIQTPSVEFSWPRFTRSCLVFTDHHFIANVLLALRQLKAGAVEAVRQTTTLPLSFFLPFKGLTPCHRT